MTKVIILSIQSQHAVNILNGDKTLELRTWIPKGYVGWVYVYVTKGKPYLIKFTSTQWLKDNIISYTLSNKTLFFEDVLNSKVAFRFWFDEYEEVLTQHHIDGEQIERVIKQACIEHEYLDKYVGDRETIYAWHIKKLEIFDEPKELSDFYVTNKGLTYKYIKEYEEQTNDNVSFRLKKAPQSWQYVYVKGESK